MASQLPDLHDPSSMDTIILSSDDDEGNVLSSDDEDFNLKY